MGNVIGLWQGGFAKTVSGSLIDDFHVFDVPDGAEYTSSGKSRHSWPGCAAWGIPTNMLFGFPGPSSRAISHSHRGLEKLGNEG